MPYQFHRTGYDHSGACYRRTSSKALYFVILFILLLLSPCEVDIFFSAPWFSSQSFCVLPRMSDTKFCTHILKWFCYVWKHKSTRLILYVLLGISPASNCSWPTFRNPVSVPSSKAGCLHPAFEDGTDTGFRNVGQLQFEAGEIPKRIYTIFKSRRKFEI